MKHLSIEGEEDEVKIQIDENQVVTDSLEVSYVLGRFLTNRHN